MSIAKESYGSTFAYGSVTVAEPTGIRLVGIDGKVIDVTHLASPNGFDEFIYGTVDPGDMECDFNLKKADVVTIYTYYRNPQTAVMTLSDGTVWTSTGAILKNIKIDAAKGEQIKGTMVLKLTGKPTLS